MTATTPFQPRPFVTPLRPEWIDYNGHLRDANYVLLASMAVDDLMEQIGIDREYRARTHGTLFTLELHVHYRQEVKAADEVTVVCRPLAADAKRVQLRADLTCPRLSGPAAVVEMLLLHVVQDPDAHAEPLPAPVQARVRSWLAATSVPADGLGSRAIGLKRPTAG